MPGGGPRLYRFYNYEQVEYFAAPTGGWNADSPPHELPDSQAPVLDNFLIRPGKIVCRGGFSVWADMTANAPLNVCGVQPHLGDANIIIGRKLVSATAYIDPWNAPIVRPPAAASIAAANSNVLIAQGGTTITTSAQTAAKTPGPRGITFEGLRYYIGYGTSSAPVADAGGTYFAQSTSLCTQSGASTFTELTNAPHGPVDLKGYQARIWLLSGIDTPGAGTTFNPLTLFFTNPIGNGGGAASADWKDPVTGLTNKIVMDGDSLDPGVGLATTRNALLIFRYSSIWALRGSTTASYTISPVSREVGCIDARSIVECDRGVYFLSHKGLMLSDGASVRNVTGPSMTQTLQNAIGVYLTSVLASFGGYATCARTSDGQILVSIGIAAATAGAPDGHIQPTWSALFSPDTGTWTRLTSPIWLADGTIIAPGNNYPGWAVSPSDKRLLTVGDKYITQLEAPASANLALVSVTDSPSAATSDAAVGSVAWTNPTNAEALDAINADVSGAITTSTKVAGTVVDDASFGADSWTTSGAFTLQAGVATLDGQFDFSSNATVGTSHYLKGTNLGFAIPSTAIITGIQLTISRKSNGSEVTDSRVRLVKAGAVQATDKASAGGWPLVVTDKSYGGSGDLWSGTWTPADINNAGFGYALAVQTLDGDQSLVDRVQITVSYILPTQYLKATGYGFAVPAGATIVGIQMTVRRGELAGTSNALDGSVRLYKAGVLAGADKASPTGWTPGALGTVTYGGPADLWGTTWTPADVNNANFGAAVAGSVVPTTIAPHWAIDWIGISVYYTIGTPTSAASFVQNPGLYDKMADGTFQPIPAIWKTRFAPLGNPTKVGHSKRFFMDYVFQGNGILASTGWSVTPSDQSASAYGSALQAPLTGSTQSSSVSGGDILPASAIQRATQDMTSELGDLSFTVAWTDSVRGSAPSNVVPELYGVGVEFQKSRDRVTGAG